MSHSYWEHPKPTSGRKCLLCGKAPAGRLHVPVSEFRGDDDVFPCCKACQRLPDVEARLYAAQAEAAK